MSQNIGLHATLTMDAGNFSAALSQARDTLAGFAVEERKLKNEITKAENALKEQANKFGKDSDEAKKASQVLEKLYRENLELQGGIKKVTDSINKQTAAFAQNAKQGNSTAEQLKKGFTVLKGLAVGYAGKTLYDALIGSNADFEQKLTSFDVLLGSADKAQKMMDDLTKFAADTPLQLPDVSKATQLLLSYGVAQEDVMTRLGQLGDLAQGNAEKLDRVSLAYGQMLAKGKVTGEELRQMTEAGVPLVQSLADVMGITTAELSKMLETGSVGIPELNKAIEAMTSEGGKFFGMMEKQAQTMSGMLSTIGDNISMFAREVGEESFDYLKDEISGLLDTIRQMEESGELQEIASEIGEGISNAVTFIGNFIQILWEMRDVLIAGAGAVVGYKVAVEGLAIVQSVITWFKGLIATFRAVTAAKQAGITIAALYKAAMLQDATALQACAAAGIKDITVKNGQTVATGAATGATLSFNAALLANPITGVVAAVGLLIAGLVKLDSSLNQSAKRTKELNEELEQMREEYGSVSKSIEDATKRVEDNTTATIAELNVVKDTIPRLEELSEKTNRTAEENDELNRIIENLNSTMPSLKLAIDDETGALNRQIDTVWDAVDAYAALAKAKAAQNLLVEAEENKIKAKKIMDESKDSVMITPWYNPWGIGMESPYEKAKADAEIYQQDAKYYTDLYAKYQKEWEALRPESSDDGGGYSGGGTSGGSSTTKKEPVYKEYTFSRPSEGTVTSGYVERTNPVTGQWEKHDGIDIGAYDGETVKASAPGKVTVAGWVDGYGNYVEIDHGNGLSTFYAHMDSIDVSVGQSVGKGVRLGGAGSTGLSTGTHIHFGAKKNGQSINPNDLVAGYYGTVWSTIEGDTKTQDSLDQEREQLRQEKVSAYQDTRETLISNEERKYKFDLAYGYITEREYIEGIKKRADAYSAWANEILSIDYMTYDEKLELIQEYLTNAEDLNLEYYEQLKAFEKDNLNYSIEQSGKWIEERNEMNDWAPDDNEAKAWGRVRERVWKFYNEDFYDPNQQREYLDIISEIDENIRNAIIEGTKKTIDEVSELKKAAYQKELDFELEKIEERYDATEAALNQELKMVKEKTDARIDYLNGLKKKRNEEKEDEEDALEMERLQTRLEYEMDEGNRASLQREINKLNEEIEDKELNRWIESEISKAEKSEEIETAKIENLLEMEEGSRKRMIDNVTDYYTEKMSAANLALEAIQHIGGYETLLQMRGLYDTIDFAGIEWKIDDLIGIIQKAFEQYGVNSITGTTIINNNNNSTTNVQNEIVLTESTPAQMTEAQKLSLKEYERTNYTS